MGLFLFGALGLAAELLLLGHTEEWRQWVPLILLGLAAVSGPLWAWRRSSSLGALFRVVVVLVALSGVVGIWFHYSGNAEFEREMYPERGGWELFRESLSGATPALAPGAMVQLGLLGLIVTSMSRARNDEQSRSGSKTTKPHPMIARHELEPRMGETPNGDRR